MAHALDTFLNILEQYQYIAYLDAELHAQLQSFYHKAHALTDIVRSKSYPGVIPEYLEGRVRDVAHKAEDVLDIYITNQVFSDWVSNFDIDLITLIEEVDSIKEEMMLLKKIDEQGNEMQAHLPNIDVTPRSDQNIYAFHGHNNRILAGVLDLLMEESSRLQILTVVGKGGMGKTFITNIIYGSLKEFHVRAWISISREFNLRTTLLALLTDLGKLTYEMRKLKDGQLVDIIGPILKRKKYLIVLDNIWDSNISDTTRGTYVNVWDQIRGFFPDDDNGSRIILTTRDLAFANRASLPSGYSYEMTPVDEEASCEFLTSDIYGYMFSPPEFGEVVHFFAHACQGSPLAIRIIGGLLRRYKSKSDFLKLIMREFTREFITMTDINEVVLSLSYKHLPTHIKPFFLYFGSLPQNYLIRPFRIAQLWIAEGFLNVYLGANVEANAEIILYYFAGLNLLMNNFVRGSNMENIFTVNDIVRDFCLKKSLEEKFLCFKDVDGPNIQCTEKIVRRVIAHPLSKPSDVESEQLSLARSFTCIGRASVNLAPMFLRLKLLRILNVFQLEFYQFPRQILQLVLLKFLAFSCHSALPPSISRLKTLQTLIMCRLPSFREFVLPSELWEMSQLRHIELKETCVVFCPKDGEHVPDLRSLGIVKTLGFSNKFLQKLPNLRKIGLFCNSSMSTLIDLSCLQELQTMKCSSDWSLASQNFLSYLTFPYSLLKISLSRCKIPWGLMRIIGALPNLEILKVQKSDFLTIETETAGEPAWEIGEREFVGLLSLHMESLNLVTWKAYGTSLPKIQNLIIRSCPSLVTIPDFVNLYTVNVDNSSPSLVKWINWN